MAAVDRNHWAEAEMLFAEGVKICPDDPDVRRHYAEALWHRGARQEAVAQLLEASQKCPEDAALRVRIAEMQLALGHVDLALQTAQLALDLDPRLAAAWAVRGRIRQAQGQPRQALADFHRALEWDPADRTVQLEIAELYRQLNQPQRALVALQSLADSYPPGEEPQQVLFLQGLACLELNRPDAAAENFAAASLRGKPTAEIFRRLAEAELLAGRPVQAAAAAGKALALAPEDQPSRKLLQRIDVAMRSSGPQQ
jgi:tetratricopeptide (TPR) repeat protein